MKQENLIKNALYNTHAKSGASVEYGQGLVVGVMSTLMATEGYGFNKTLAYIVTLLPEGYRVECIPKPWRDKL